MHLPICTPCCQTFTSWIFSKTSPQIPAFHNIHAAFISLCWTECQMVNCSDSIHYHVKHPTSFGLNWSIFSIPFFTIAWRYSLCRTHRYHEDIMKEAGFKSCFIYALPWHYQSIHSLRPTVVSTTTTFTIFYYSLIEWSCPMLNCHYQMLN